MSDYIFERLLIKVNGVEKFYNVPKTNECPHCHNTIAPYVLTISETDMETRTFAILAQCPHCSKYFTMAYKLPFGTKVPKPIEYIYEVRRINESLPLELKSISERFVEMYSQSLMAQIYNLNKIASMGFKKSIEFLMRDYFINVKNQEKDEILKLPLGEVIKKILDLKIVDLALSSDWLKSDNFYEDHFEKKDVDDMKKFIDVFSKYIIYNNSYKK